MHVARFSFRPLGEESALQEVPETAQGAEPAPPAVFSEEELYSAKSEAFSRGYQEGQEAGIALGKSEAYTLDMSLKAAIDTILLEIDGVVQTHTAYLNGQKRMMTKLACSIAKKVAGHALQKNPEAEIEAIVLQCLPLMIAQPRITLFVHPDLVHSMDKRLQYSAATHVGERIFKVHPDVTLPLEDCRLEWQNADAVRTTEELWKEIESVIDKYVQVEEMQDHDPSAISPVVEASMLISSSESSAQIPPT